MEKKKKMEIKAELDSQLKPEKVNRKVNKT